MRRKCQVVMLPTQKASNLYIHNKRLYKGELYNSIGGEGQYLYILSDEEIKEGEYVFVNSNIRKHFKKVTKVNSAYYETEDLELISKEIGKKVIATTNPELIINQITKGTLSGQPIDVYHEGILPQISQDFIQDYIKKYNSGNIIKEVMVEYDEEAFSREVPGVTREILKISTDNTIYISRVKSSKISYIDVYEEYCSECLNNDGDYSKSFIEWLKTSNYQFITI